MEINYLTERLSDELLMHIVKFVADADDRIHLAEICKKFHILLQDKEFCEQIKFLWCHKMSRNSITWFLKDRIRVSIITNLDLSDLYWIPSGIIRDLAIRMNSLETLLAAGTPLLWVHLSQLLRSLSIKKLSWSWDNNLEESCRKRSSIAPTKFMELTELKDNLLPLKSLLIHIPMATKVATDLLFYSYSSLVYLISLCQNLEELWMMSWPKTPAERKSSSSFNRLDMEELGLQFLNLHTLVISVKDPPRFSTMSFFDKLIRMFGIVKPAKVFWLDHPLLGVRALISIPRRNSMQTIYNAWTPQVFSEEAERLSYSLMAYNDVAKPNVNYSKLKHVLVNHGSPVVVGLNGVFDASPDLESFCCAAFNLRMEWKKFVEKHPKLKAVSINESQSLEEYCVSLSKLTDLEKLSVSAECLYEIKDAEALSEYSISQLTKEKTDTTSEKPSHSRDQQTPLFKKRRVGARSIPSQVDETRVSGLNLITEGCPKMNELEIGYSKINNSRAGRLLPESLFSISKFQCLQKLSLSGLPVNNGKFLIEVCSKCDITSLRLTHLGLSGKCCYMQDLCQALAHCDNLRDFRVEQNYIGSPAPLFQALQNCSKLQRLLIWSSPNDKPFELQHAEDLFESCHNLMMFYVTIEPTTKSVCFRSRKALEAKYKRDRPALSIVLRSTVEEEELIYYPSVHYRQMVVNISQVCQFNDFTSFTC